MLNRWPNPPVGSSSRSPWHDRSVNRAAWTWIDRQTWHDTRDSQAPAPPVERRSCCCWPNHGPPRPRCRPERPAPCRTTANHVSFFIQSSRKDCTHNPNPHEIIVQAQMPPAQDSSLRPGPQHRHGHADGVHGPELDVGVVGRLGGGIPRLQKSPHVLRAEFDLQCEQDL